MKIDSSPLVPHSPEDWLRPVATRNSYASWAGSVLFHGLLALLILQLARSPGCRGDFGGEGGESFRSVGIHFGDPGGGGTGGGNGNDLPESPSPVDTKPPSATSPLTVAPSPLAEAPPVSLQLPELGTTFPAVIGAGPPAPAIAELGEQFLRPASGTGPSGAGKGTGTGSGQGGGGGTSFIGIRDVGTKFVYVIDRSASMATDNALQAAKNELQASLSRLSETQQFQVIFYNNEHVMLDPRGGRGGLFWGTDAQRLVVTQQLATILPEAGTQHLPALLTALSLNPDVIYLLTDGAAESVLSSGDFALVRRENRRKTRIHCVEFGRGRKSALGDAGNFLKKLAAEHQGQYIYRDISAGLGGETRTQE
ncbi:vWA domain-containing protein [Planctomicrobium sp. SH664]|uniref:vWA domain-containing protein n=1 Tax=Planctomicrobium sp. SH664 TaxID=3448125 RepID=UPI003F5B4157